MEDREIIDLFWQRSEAALEETQQKYGAFCSRVAGNILKDPEDVRECLNDAYLAYGGGFRRRGPAYWEPISIVWYGICR